MMCGGASAARPATEETQRIAEQVRGRASPVRERRAGECSDLFISLEFRKKEKDLTGFCALQVHVGNDEFMHLRVFKSLPHENEQLSLHSYQGSKTKHDDLAYF
ncbi:cystatin-B-like [Malurus melanocephalus]|uniref:cystatin-B-like n=1 Tax=Malurus melanocephalus TaxID=175006 RepID=UPI0025475F62|nr:cystatin-B-like [Malurus melanocephalus]